MRGVLALALVSSLAPRAADACSLWVTAPSRWAADMLDRSVVIAEARIAWRPCGPEPSWPRPWEYEDGLSWLAALAAWRVEPERCPWLVVVHAYRGDLAPGAALPLLPYEEDWARGSDVGYVFERDDPKTFVWLLGRHRGLYYPLDAITSRGARFSALRARR